MIRMLGRLMWVAVGALGLKAWEASEQQRNAGNRGGSTGGGSQRAGGRTRSTRSASSNTGS